MAHLACKKHKRRVLVFPGTDFDLTDTTRQAHINAIHRQDGSHCEGSWFKMGAEIYSPLEIVRDWSDKPRRMSPEKQLLTAIYTKQPESIQGGSLAK